MGVAIYTVVERAAPAPYAEAMLARAALDRGDTNRAQKYALRLPASAGRNEILGTIAQARGDDASAQRYFIAAADVFRIAAYVNALARRDVPAAYALETQLKDRLQRVSTHPDALAEAYWRLGQLATLRGYHDRTARARWDATGMNDYMSAVALAPLDEKYLLAAGIQSLALRNPVAALHYFRRALDSDPAGADAYAGLGMASLQSGNRAAAQRYARRSRTLNATSSMLRSLEKQLR